MRRNSVAAVLLFALMLGTAALGAKSVPRDRILPCVGSFQAPSKEEALTWFREAHRRAECRYAGEGDWGGTPNVRNTSSRVIGYLDAYVVTGDNTYKDRAQAGLERLLKLQTPRGSFLWYSRNEEDGFEDDDNSLFETGLAGRALLRGYEIFKDPRFLKASAVTADWEKRAPVSTNTNYNMFAVWHLAAHYAVTGDRSCLESAIYKTSEGCLRDQLPSGGWPDHNSFIWYHAFIIRGMAELYSVLPPDHPFRPRLRRALVAAVNRIVTEQDPDGGIPPNLSVTNDRDSMSVLQALALAQGALKVDLSCTTNGFVQYLIQSQRLLPPDYEPPRWKRQPKAAPTGGPVLSEGFESGVRHSKYGVAPAGWSAGWLQGWKPSVEDIKIGLNKDYPRTGRTALEVRCIGTGKELNAGVFWLIPADRLVQGHDYLARVWVMGHESSRTCRSVKMFQVSACSDDKLDEVAYSASTIISRSMGYYTRAQGRFRAGKENGLYVTVCLDRVPTGEQVTMLVDDVEIFDLGPPPPSVPQGPKVHTDASELMGVGAYLLATFGR